MSGFRRLIPVVCTLALAATLAGCGSADTDPANDTPDAGIPSIRSWLTTRTADLADDADRIRTAAGTYASLVRSRNSNYRKLIREDCPAVASSLREAKNALLDARQSYSEITALVAGIPRMAQYDTDLAAGSASADPRDAVSFALKTPAAGPIGWGHSLFYLLETSLYGTEPRLQAGGGVKPDSDCDGRSRFGEGFPDAAAFRAIAGEFARQTTDLESDADEIVVTESDAFTGMVTMLPAVGDYIDQWKRSAFVAGENDGGERQFVASSRLSDLADLLAGINFVYRQVRGAIEEQDRDRAVALSATLGRLAERAGALRDREASGRRFTPADADRIAAGMERRARSAAGRLEAAADELDVEIQAP